ncbi:phosphatase PAP2 family protein [Ruania alkalisoli]|uniref:Phosphatase PAP2 family protein n=1 Tax=Ruania alkalisoli TaxID=2779775 RepID=A0A7M1STI4_9MICO|nr:phosphatase PAP2 family protein [Ruania alkalisoli]QOR70082.1 phosphatase PAP2 family protein [Ruania alkalisoli]
MNGIELLSEVTLLALALATAATGILAWRRSKERRALLFAASAGVVCAYGLSETAKLLFAQERPCTRWALPGECPPPGDWSLPSNHATLAFGAVIVIALATRHAWVTWAALTTAILVGTGRILQGVHYLHDVAFGALLGASVPAVAALIIHAWMKRRPGRV